MECVLEQSYKSISTKDIAFYLFPSQIFFVVTGYHCVQRSWIIPKRPNTDSKISLQDISKNKNFLVHLKYLISLISSWLLSFGCQKQARNSEINNQKDVRVNLLSCNGGLLLGAKSTTDFINLVLMLWTVLPGKSIKTISLYIHVPLLILFLHILFRAILSKCHRAIQNVILCFCVCVSHEIWFFTCIFDWYEGQCRL